MVNETMLPFLMYMAKVQPDIAQQLMVSIWGYFKVTFFFFLNFHQMLNDYVVYKRFKSQACIPSMFEVF
jgi:hypothetical protein